MKKRIFLSIATLLLCITVSFAWISNMSTNIVNTIDINFLSEDQGNLSVASRDLEAQIYIKDGDEFVPADENSAFDSSLFVPGSNTPFKIKIHNNAKKALYLEMTLAFSETSYDGREEYHLRDALFIDIYAGEGFPQGEIYHQYKNLAEAEQLGSSDEYILEIYNEDNMILIPEMAEDEWVTLECYFYFDMNATAEYQNMSMKKFVFRLE